jgi:DNA polymerase-3 subunit delta
LEKYFAAAAEKPDVTGVLVLDVTTWAGTTKLARMTPDNWLITCKAPAVHLLPQWAVRWCAEQHGKQLSAGAAKLLVDLVGSEMGLLDQELAKLAVYAGNADKIDVRDVDELVGRRRAENTWRIFDFIGTGQAREALDLLQKLLDQGEDPLRLLGAFSSQLRQLAKVTRLSAQGVTLKDAMNRGGVPGYRAAQDGADQLLRHLGRRRLDRLYDWLLETDLGMKGGSQLPPRILLERLVIRLARPRT